jgi:hypothetical protein
MPPRAICSFALAFDTHQRFEPRNLSQEIDLESAALIVCTPSLSDFSLCLPHISVPVDSRQFVLVREVVSDSSGKRFL